MNSIFSVLLVFVNQIFMPQRNTLLRLLKAQIAILRGASRRNGSSCRPPRRPNCCASEKSAGMLSTG